MIGDRNTSFRAHASLQTRGKQIWTWHSTLAEAALPPCCAAWFCSYPMLSCGVPGVWIVPAMRLYIGTEKACRQPMDSSCRGEGCQKWVHSMLPCCPGSSGSVLPPQLHDRGNGRTLRCCSVVTPAKSGSVLKRCCCSVEGPSVMQCPLVTAPNQPHKVAGSAARLFTWQHREEPRPTQAHKSKQDEANAGKV